ncbi:hypothetical protein A2U01_0060056 [Trifolium medium]|uniref:Uncharacterized protein n=1 Tax=Trifolium medium TaxID=97028 RepID=A0A392RRK6_9FABA|nr:hypothetical protein [Trifolium medium]
MLFLDANSTLSEPTFIIINPSLIDYSRTNKDQMEALPAICEQDPRAGKPTPYGVYLQTAGEKGSVPADTKLVVWRQILSHHPQSGYIAKN